MFCNKCGKQIPDDAIFCSWCGEAIVRVRENNNAEAPVQPVQPEPTVAYEEPAPAPTAPVQPEFSSNDADLREEQEFLDLTHRLLRWERKAWSIMGKVMLIFGIVCSAIIFLCGVILVGIGDYETENIGVAYIVLSVFYAALLIPIGIVCQKCAGKIPQYLDSMYYDFEKTELRSGSVGMLVLTALFNNIAFIFFIINFVRLKANPRVIARIKSRQNNR